MNRLLFSLLVLGTLLLDGRVLVAQPRPYPIDSLKVLLKQSRLDTNRANLLLEMALSYVLKPGDLASDLDTALLLVRQGYSISRYFHFAKGEGKAYLYGAQAYRWKEDIQQARRFGQTAINLFTKNGNTAELAAAHMELGNSYSNEREELKLKIIQYELALPLFRQVRQREREAITLRMLAEFYYLQSNFKKASEFAIESLAIYKQISYSDLQGIYDLLGALSSNSGDYKMGLEYGLLALKTAELRKDTTIQLGTIYNRIGVIYFNLSDYLKAIQYCQHASKIAKQHKDLELIKSSANNVAIAYTRLRQYKKAINLLITTLNSYPEINLAYKAQMNSSIVSIYQKMGEYNKAQFYSQLVMNQLAQLRKLNREQDVIIFAYPPLIRFFISTHQLSLAKSYLSRLEGHTNYSGNKRQIVDKQLLLFQLDSAQGNYLSAIKNFTKYKVLYDSLYNESKNKEIARLGIEFETEKKEQEIKLKEANIQLLKKENQAQQDTQKFTLIGAFMLVLLLGVTFNRYRLKQRTNLQLEAKQQLIDQKNQTLQQLLEEREWMLKEIHHRVKNNLQVISSMLNAQFNFLQDPSALTAIRESQNRVQVMALIHQKLYQTDNLAQIGMNEYIHQIVDYLIESFDRLDRVRTQLSIADVYFDVSLATPLGLIINEAVTNSLKYAFPAQAGGVVGVRLSQVEAQTYQLTIRDDGVGLPVGFDVDRSKTLGLTMIRGLSKQIKAKLDISQRDGLEIALQFSTVKKLPETVLYTSKHE